MSKKSKIITSIVTAILYWLAYQLFLPTFSLAHFSGFVFIAIGVIAIALNDMLWLMKEDDLAEDYYWKIPGWTTRIAVLIAIFVGIGSLAPFHADSMFNQIGEIEIKSFVEDIVQIDNSQIPIVDIALADKLADKRLGEDSALGSISKVGKFTNKQAVNDKLIYVAPLEHGGNIFNNFWKWLSNRKGTTGYLTVSATNFNDAQLVQQVEGKELRLKYLESAYFGDDLKRYLRNNGYATVGLTDFTFELADNGYPYWVVTTYKNTTLWRNPEATGVVILDPQTGEHKWYSVEDTPEWVDIIQPEEFIERQINNHGSLINGWWNPSEKDETAVTPHITTVYNNGECYYYTGLTSKSADQGTVGFIMVNTRDKSSIMYKMSGATEAAAMKSAEGKVKNMQYTATTPIPLNVSGIPTYFCTLKDGEGLVKSYSMINVKNYSIVEVGNTIMEARRAYINAVNSSDNSVSFSGDEVYAYTAEGVVSRIGSNIESGNTYYYMILNDNSSKIFLASYSISEELPLTREGDNVKVFYVDEKSTGSINIVAFDNLDFNLEEGEKTNLVEIEDNKITTVDPEANQKEWNDLTEEEKSKLLESIKNIDQ